MLLGGISYQTLYQLVADRSLRLVKVRRRSFIRRDDIDALIERGASGRDGQ
jgi:excisionase family DNA binding protein